MTKTKIENINKGTEELDGEQQQAIKGGVARSRAQLAAASGRASRTAAPRPDAVVQASSEGLGPSGDLSVRIRDVTKL